LYFGATTVLEISHTAGGGESTGRSSGIGLLAIVVCLALIEIDRRFRSLEGPAENPASETSRTPNLHRTSEGFLS
jgi:hypothetical protein